MKKNWKIKCLFLASTISSILIPMTILLTSCSESKPIPDVIEHYQDAEGGIFNDTQINKESTPFKCDFNITQKTCSIVEWITNKPNYLDTSLPTETIIGSNKKINNTARIPSKILYKNEYYTVESFKSLEWSTQDKVLDIGKLSTYLYAIDFDVNMKLKECSYFKKNQISPKYFTNFKLSKQFTYWNWKFN